MSPDGGWIAYESNESGRFEIYVQSFLSLQGELSVSTDGGEMPPWPRTGRELFYRDLLVLLGHKMQALWEMARRRG
jgi:hypothetical protein